MARSIWSGTIEIHRIREKENVDVRYEEITHGYYCEDDTPVIVSDREPEAIEPRRTRRISRPWIKRMARSPPRRA